MASIFEQTKQLVAPENDSCFPKLSFKERVLGFLLFSVLGYLLEFLSFGAFFKLMAGKPIAFAVAYTLGNILALFG